jgi:hypothetical protein
VTTGNQRHNGQPNRLRLALDDSFDSTLQPLDLLDGAGAGLLSRADWFEVPHELACILHAKSTPRTEKLAAGAM